MIKIKRLTDALEVIGEEVEDYIADAIRDALNEFKDDELEEVKQDAYEESRQVDYRVDSADAEIDDLKIEVRELQNRLDSLEEK